MTLWVNVHSTEKLSKHNFLVHFAKFTKFLSSSLSVMVHISYQRIQQPRNVLKYFWKCKGGWIFEIWSVLQGVFLFSTYLFKRETCKFVYTLFTVLMFLHVHITLKTQYWPLGIARVFLFWFSRGEYCFLDRARRREFCSPSLLPSCKFFWENLWHGKVNLNFWIVRRKWCS